MPAAQFCMVNQTVHEMDIRQSGGMLPCPHLGLLLHCKALWYHLSILSTNRSGSTMNKLYDPCQFRSSHLVVEERSVAEAPMSTTVEVDEEEGSLVHSTPCGRAYGGALGNEGTLSHL